MIRRLGALTLASTVCFAAHGQGLGIFVRVMPTCSVHTIPAPVALSCGSGDLPNVRLLTGKGAQVYAGSSLMEATRVAQTTRQVGGATYLVVDF